MADTKKSKPPRGRLVGRLWKRLLRVTRALLVSPIAAGLFVATLFVVTLALLAALVLVVASAVIFAAAFVAALGVLAPWHLLRFAAAVLTGRTSAWARAGWTTLVGTAFVPRNVTRHIHDGILLLGEERTDVAGNDDKPDDQQQNAQA